MRSEMAAQALVEDFLENGRLRNFEKAKELLLPSIRRYVSEDELEQMFSLVRPLMTASGLADFCAIFFVHQ